MRVCRTFLRICMRECVFVCVFACERGGACERKKERERDREAHGVREIGMIWREKCRGREMIYFPCRYDDRAIGESTKEKTRERESEQRKMREFRRNDTYARTRAV